MDPYTGSMLGILLYFLGYGIPYIYGKGSFFLPGVMWAMYSSPWKTCHSSCHFLIPSFSPSQLKGSLGVWGQVFRVRGLRSRFWGLRVRASDLP